MTRETEILDLIDAWARAELEGDIDTYAQLLAEDFAGVGPVGFVLDADQWAGRHQGDLVNRELEVLDPRVRFYGETAVVVAVQRQVTTARGRDTSGSFRLAAVCVPAGGGWRIAHLQLSGPMIAPGEMPGFAR